MVVKMNSINIDGNIYNYVVNYKNIKNIYLRVKSDKVIYVSANRFVSKKSVEDMILQNKEFIYSSLKKIDNKNEENHKLKYLGNDLELIISDKTYIDGKFVYAKDYDSAKQYIYSLAYDVFENRLNSIKPQFDYLPNFKLKVRRMKTRWGVCNKKSMTVTLNLELITKDVHLIDYVIVHELSHFKHMDHSKLFWEEVGMHYPYYKRARKELNSGC